MDETEVDPFADINTDTSAFSNAKPFGAKERIIIQNFFDSNDAARAKYLKQLGYEMAPDDDNLIRPIGSSAEWREIDPGFSDAFKKGGFSELAKEVFQDAGDIAYDATDVGAKLLSAGGGALAGLLTGGTGSIPLAIAGAAAAGATSSTIKQNVRQMFLDEDIPFDLKEAAIDAALSAGGAGAFKYGAKGIKAIGDLGLNARISAMKNAIKRAGSLSDPDLVERAARNPELFTKEAVDGGAVRLNQAYKKMFGLEPDEFADKVRDFDSIPTDSLFGKQIKPLKELADQETKNLTMNAGANVKYSDISGKLQKAYFNLEEAMNNGDMTSTTVEAHKALGQQLKNLKDLATKSAARTRAPLSTVELDYGQARNFVKSLQDATFVQTGNGFKSQNPIMGQIAGEARRELDAVATNAGSKLPDLNAHMHQIYTDFNKAQAKLKPESIFSAYIGGTTPGARAKAQDIQNFIGSLDEKYGSDLAKEFDVNAAQGAFESVYKGTPAKGSSRVNAMMYGEIADSALKGLGAGAGAGSLISGIGTGLGAGLGFVGGGLKGARDAAALATPEDGLMKLSTLLQRQTARDAGQTGLAEQAIKGALGVGGAMASQRGVEGDIPESEEVDPFADF